MTPGHLERLRRVRDLLSDKGYDTRETIRTCYCGAGFDRNLRASDDALLIDLNTLYES
ncbi:hypothetical protein [Nocardia sp. NPDC005366]|uniref:hypothetical protein n=1 Tax=Nocardia sp. NPDC005366 TaxID=3156878 RepID=UPI0033A85751